MYGCGLNWLLFLSCYGTASIWFIIMRLLPVSLKDMTRRMFFDIQLNIKPVLQNDSVLMSHSAEYLEQIYHLINNIKGWRKLVFIMGQYLIREIICMRDMLRIRIRLMW